MYSRCSQSGAWARGSPQQSWLASNNSCLHAHVCTRARAHTRTCTRTLISRPACLRFSCVAISLGFETDSCGQKGTLGLICQAIWSHGCHPACLLCLQMALAGFNKIGKHKVCTFSPSLLEGAVCQGPGVEMGMLYWLFGSVPYVYRPVTQCVGERESLSVLQSSPFRVLQPSTWVFFLPCW